MITILCNIAYHFLGFILPISGTTAIEQRPVRGASPKDPTYILRKTRLTQAAIHDLLGQPHIDNLSDNLDEAYTLGMLIEE